MRDPAHQPALRPWRLGGLLALIIASLAPSPPGHAASSTPVEREEAHAARRLAVAGLVGSLRIERHERADIRLVLRGSAAALARVRREVRGDRLQLTVAPGPAATGTVVAGNNTVVALGGRATQSIGSLTGSVGVGAESEPPLELDVYVPSLAPLTITALIGTLAVRGVGGPVELELVAGEASIDRASGGSLTAVAGGRIELAHAKGDLRIAVAGAGDVVIAEAALDDLEVGLSGTGQVTVGGVAERASVRIAGVGSVAIDQVRERPAVSVAGLGRVAIGNW